MLVRAAKETAEEGTGRRTQGRTVITNDLTGKGRDALKGAAMANVKCAELGWVLPVQPESRNLLPAAIPRLP